MTLRELREQRRYAQIEVAQALGVALTTVSNWERGATKPELRMRRRLAEFYKVDPDAIDRCIDATAAARTGMTTQQDAISDDE